MDGLCIVAWGWLASSFVGIVIIILYSIGSHLHYKYGYDKMFYHPDIKKIIVLNIRRKINESRTSS